MSAAQKNKRLRRCGDCSQQISKKATACPHCGRRYGMGLTRQVINVLLVMGLLLFWLGLGASACGGGGGG